MSRTMKPCAVMTWRGVPDGMSIAITQKLRDIKGVVFEFDGGCAEKMGYFPESGGATGRLSTRAGRRVR